MNLKSSYLITIQNFLFVLFLVTTAWFNRWSADDYYFIGELNQKSFIEVYKHLHFNWHGRWTSNFFQLITFKYHHIPGFLFSLNLFTFSFLTISIYQLIKSVSKLISIQLSSKRIWMYSFAFLSVFFFCCVNPASTWFWQTSTVVYLWSVTAFIFLVSRLLKESISFFDYLILILSSIYIGGSNEPLAIITIIGLVFWYYRKKLDIKSMLSAVLILIALLINYFSSGTEFRDEITPGLGFIDLILYTGYGSLKYLLFNSYKTFIPAIILALPFYLLGRKQPPIGAGFNLKRETLVSFLIIIVAVVINQFIVVYALGGSAPDRSTTTSSIIISFVLVRYFFLLGQQHHNRKTNLAIVVLVSVIGMLVFNGFTSIYHYRYAKGYDQRIESIKSSKNGVIEVAPLPFSGYIYSAEISSDNKYFLNQHLKNGLGLKQEVVLKTK